MKKTILIAAAVVFVALTGTQAFACYWDGYWGGPMGGPMAGYSAGNYQSFYEQTAQLRRDLAAKQGEYNALMAKNNPDPQRAAELKSQIVNLHDQLRSQASSYNLPAPNSGYGGMRGGRMMGGRMMGGYGCW